MKKALLCSLLVTLLPWALSANLQLNSDGGNKLSVWLQSRLRRELCAPDSLEDSGEFQQQNEDTGSPTLKHRYTSSFIHQESYLHYNITVCDPEQTQVLDFYHTLS
ncbi:hypothetical protein NFI96_012835, partial [Prochilodus magdalenae]